MATNYPYKLPECYIYLYHTDEYFILPQYPDGITDNMSTNFAETNALSRTAPVYAYINSGPRSIRIDLQLHRDLMNDVNTQGSNIKMNDTSSDNNIITEITDDYVDLLIKKLQSIALPNYQSSTSEVDPPRVAIRFGDEIFIKGVVKSGVSVTYGLPLLNIVRNETSYSKYAKVSVAFDVYEAEPYDADIVGQLGSFRGLTAGLEAKMGGAK